MIEEDIEANSPPTSRAKVDRRSSKNGNPEALIRDDTWWIHCLRVFLIGTLVVVAIGLSVATYKLLSKLQYETFRNEFGTVASGINQAFLQDMQLKLWVASFVTLAVSKKGGEQGDYFLDANTEFLNKLSLGVGSLTYWSQIGFSPILWTQTDRHEWETYARGSSHNNANKICQVCGEGMEMTSSEESVYFPGYGTVPCSFINKAGLNGRIPEKKCPFLPPFVQSACQCHPVGSVTGGQEAAINTTEVPMASQIFRIKDGMRIPDNQPPPFCPIWQAAPQPQNDAIMYNQMSDPMRREAIKVAIETKLPTFSRTRYPDGEYQNVSAQLLGTPSVTLFYPIIDQNQTNKNHSVTGLIAIDMTWISVWGFSQGIPPKSNGVVFVVENNRGQMFTLHVDSTKQIAFLGEGDLHDPRYDFMVQESSTDDLKTAIIIAAPEQGTNLPDTTLLYKIRIYPSDEFKAQFVTRKPVYYTVMAASIFVFTSAIFIFYDILVRRRQIKVMQAALQSNAIVTSVFPEFVTSRLMTNATATRRPFHTEPANNRRFSPLPFGTPKHQLSLLLGAGSQQVANLAFGDSEPIADFFPNVTVLFADIAGFTAWSSEREPVQVFQLLETVYQTFDTIAVKHGVFKVETIGDCYVAVMGLPLARADHAVQMARYAYEIMLHMHELAASLESLLGPGTGSLSIRVGLHSGSVTGGVLRGDKARFQLFGDTMNTAARMESTGKVNMIQASDATAALLREAGHDHWVDRREKKVFVKGKGDMQTFWIDPQWQEPYVVGEPTLSSVTMCDTLPEVGMTKKGSVEHSLERLVNWNADLLEKFLKKVVAARRKVKRRHQRRSSMQVNHVCMRTPIKDVTEVIEMSKFCEKAADEQLEPELVDLEEEVRVQLRQYVECIAGMYRDNAFHNFEHASHVAMSASKILKRVIKPEGIDYQQEYIKKKDRKKAVAEQIHNSTFGISSDALMQFAVIFSAVIHDVDHTGVSNAQLVKEKHEVAIKYAGKCVAEQNSVQIAWDLLMEERFNLLRSCIYTSSDEKNRFRQLIVNAVIATDIADSELQALRKNRWYKAFYDDESLQVVERHRGLDDDISCKATVVFEYIIQASDVAHTMQHWHVYNKWNERLFEERYLAYLAGREEKDPSLGWYNGEIWFFDNYIIPLARKLETCGVFGVSSDEYLNYALANRHEWERRGYDIVQQMREKYSGAKQA